MRVAKTDELCLEARARDNAPDTRDGRPAENHFIEEKSSRGE